ncbi:Golgi apyrase [Neolecta irregularis DAH-3]|uniref:Golgi apyrase n=1 Tax=Neolecta irregularis (strain DAH-3) TaxID=1198029 RepID=A0A1U7LGA1_NEOID|nr:Golgi apyrase [Neolecta irregularis DAH-3]|eukprot:OLL21684.1 Golgi apyrase [Neolecta irregularis DAH-3]
MRLFPRLPPAVPPDFYSSRQDREWAQGRRFGVVIDAGSSGSRVQIYSWLDNAIAAQDATGEELYRTPAVEKGQRKGKEWTFKMHPGISTFTSRLEDLGKEHLKPLLDHALQLVPPPAVATTPLFLLATAGMRLLTPDMQRAILSETCRYARQYTEFLLPDCDLHIQVIDGETEGLYGWVALNYLLGGFDNPQDLASTARRSTYGFLDLGGASAQIAFAPNATEAEKHKDDLILLRLRSLDGHSREWKVFVTTWLGYGANEARKRYIEQLAKSQPKEELFTSDPCLPKNAQETFSPSPETSPAVLLVGTGDLKSCLLSLEPVLGKHLPCPDDPCFFGGVHTPLIDFDVNHFVGISEYWYSSNDVFELGGAYDYVTYSKKVAEFCTQNWPDTMIEIENGTYGKHVSPDKARKLCFKAAWVIEILHDGFGFPKIPQEELSSYNGTTDLIQGANRKGFDVPFQSVNEIDKVEISWTLGKMLLYASSEVLSDSPDPVGFGPYINNGKASFHLAGESQIAYPSNHIDFRRLSGMLLFMIMFAIVIWLLIGRNRRSWILTNVRSCGLCRQQRKVMNASGYYERILEEGSEPSIETITGKFELSEMRRIPVSQENLSRPLSERTNSIIMGHDSSSLTMSAQTRANSEASFLRDHEGHRSRSPFRQLQN